MEAKNPTEKIAAVAPPGPGKFFKDMWIEQGKGSAAVNSDGQGNEGHQDNNPTIKER